MTVVRIPLLRLLAMAMPCWLLLLPFAASAALTPEQQLRINTSTFEVVVPKPVDDPLSYERPLPLELLPYQYRTDKYFSIGTAFALGNHRYATAAHVLNAAIGSQYGVPALRDSQGRVYAIDQMEKYSAHEDFAVFTLVDEPAVTALELNPRPVVNQIVYAVGNALGTGIVIRDGLYTSDTPEEQDGRWKFMRFSAAASPGNSGGPLLDEQARIIGIVQRKSDSENLNFALPIQRVLDAPDHRASADRRQTYRLDIFDRSDTATFRFDLALPKSFPEFAAAFKQAQDRFGDAQLERLLTSNAALLFPSGAGSERALTRVLDGAQPGLIMRSDDGQWNRELPGKLSRAELDHNGYLTYGPLRSNLLLHLRRPDDLSAADLYSDTRKLMELLQQALNFKRSVGPEQVRITSLGPAIDDRVYVDRWQRRWQVRSWAIPYNDGMVVAFCLPVPDGYALMLRVSTARQRYGNTADLQALADFATVNYGGTLAQWRDYLHAAERLLPPPLQGTHLRFTPNDPVTLHLITPRFALELPGEVLALGETSRLELDLAYFRDGDHVAWDVAGLELKQDAHSGNAVRVLRHARPDAALDDGFQSFWTKLLHGRHPFDGEPVTDGDVTSVRAVQPLAGAADTAPAWLYSTRVDGEGVPPADALKARLAKLGAGLRVTER